MTLQRGRAEKWVIALLLVLPFLRFFGALNLWIGDYLKLYGLVSLLWLGLWLLRAGAGLSRLPSTSWWDFSLLACGAWMALATVVNLVEIDPSERARALGALWSWEMGILLALYARRNFGSLYDTRFVVTFATAVLAFEVAVCLAQYLALSGDGPVAAQLAQALGVKETPERFMVGGGGVRIARVVGTFYNANSLGACIVLLLPFVVYRVCAEWERRNFLVVASSLLLVLLSLVILLRNLARVPILIGLVVLLAASTMAVWRGANRRHRLAFGFIVLLLAAMGTWVGMNLGRGSDLARVVGAKVDEGGDAAGVRLGLMTAAAQALSRQPLLGFGLGRGAAGMPGVIEVARAVSPTAAQRYKGGGSSQAPAHNLYLMMAMDGGLPVLLFFLIAAAIACVDAVKVLRYGGLAEGCLALSVLGGLILAMAELSTLLWAFLLFNMGSLRAVSGNQAHLSGASGRGAAASSRPRPLSLYADRSGGGAESAEREAEA